MQNVIKSKIMKRVKKVHFIGIGGSGMSGIASILNDLGYEVTGSDLNSSKNTEQLIKKGIDISIGHNKDNILSKDVIVISSAVQQDNVEFTYDRKLNIVKLPTNEIFEKSFKQEKFIKRNFKLLTNLFSYFNYYRFNNAHYE